MTVEVGPLETDRLSAVCRIQGLNKKERGRVAALTARRNWLEMKLANVPPTRLGYEHAELSALEWALEIIQEHFDHLNAEEC